MEALPTPPCRMPGHPGGQRPRPPGFPSPPHGPAWRQPCQEEPQGRDQLQPLPPGPARNWGARWGSDPPAAAELKGTERLWSPRAGGGLAAGTWVLDATIQLGAPWEPPSFTKGEVPAHQRRAEAAGAGAGAFGPCQRPAPPLRGAPTALHRGHRGLSRAGTPGSGVVPPSAAWRPAHRCGNRQQLRVYFLHQGHCGNLDGCHLIPLGSLGRLCSRHRAQLAAASSPGSPCPSQVTALAGSRWEGAVLEPPAGEHAPTPAPSGFGPPPAEPCGLQGRPERWPCPWPRGTSPCQGTWHPQGKVLPPPPIPCLTPAARRGGIAKHSSTI